MRRTQSINMHDRDDEVVEEEEECEERKNTERITVLGT